MIEIKVVGQKSTKTKFTEIVSGAINYRTIKFTLNEDWDELTKIVQFTNGEVTHEILMETDTVTIPTEVLATAGYLYVKVRGVLLEGDGEVVETRITANPQIFKITVNGVIDMNEVQPVTPSMYDQLTGIAAQARDEVIQVRPLMEATELLKQQTQQIKDSALTEVGDAKTGAVGKINSTKDTAIGAVNATKDSAIDTVNSTKDTAIGAVNATKDSAIGEVNSTKDAAVSAINGAKSGALNDIDAAKSGAVTDVGTAKTGALNEIANAKADALEDMGALLEDCEDIRDELQGSIDQLEMNTADIAELKSLSTFYDPYNDGLFTDIYGIEVDFANRKFTRLAGAVGKTPGADFDGILAFGGRKRCNLADNGTVNAYFGDAGYIEDGSNGQVMVEQNKFYYKVVPLKLEKNDEPEITSIKFNTAATDSGNITITLNGVSQNVAVTNGDGVNDVATKVRNTNFAGWTTSGSTSTVVFTKNKVVAVTAPTFSGGTTGVTATITRTQAGFIGKGFKLRKARYYISMTKKAGFKVHPAFVKNGVEKEKIYLSAFEGSLFDVSTSAYILDDAQIADFTATTGDKLASRANVKPISGNTQDLTRRKCGVLAENRGIGWSQQYGATAACTQLLLIVEYGTMNSQTAIGKGVVDKPYVASQNNSEITGATTLLGNASGMAAGTNGLVPITYRGEENFWGNICKFTDGMNIYCDIVNNIHGLYVTDHTFVESKKDDNYKNAGITLATRQGYVSAMAYSEEFDWLFVPSETLGDTALPVGDYFSQTSTTNGYKMARLGGGWRDGLSNGAFCWYVTNAPSSRNANIGGRLVYVPN